MGNCLNEMARLENQQNRDFDAVEREIFQAGVNWGRRDMLTQVVVILRDAHDAEYDTAGGRVEGALDGYALADRLVKDWAPSNAISTPSGVQPGDQE